MPKRESLTDVQTDILRCLLGGRKRWSEILREIGVSKKGLSKSLDALEEWNPQLVRKIVSAADRAVSYEINDDARYRVRDLLHKSGMPKLDRYRRVQGICDEILTSNENEMRKCLMINKAMVSGSSNIPFLGEFEDLLTELAWASRAFLNNDPETCSKLREHAKRNFTKLFHLVYELTGRNSFPINLAFAEANEEVSTTWEGKFKSVYPGGKRILEEAQHERSLVGTDLESLRNHATKVENSKSAREWFKELDAFQNAKRESEKS